MANRDMRTAHICNGLGGSLWAGAILGWQSVYAIDHDAWRCDRVREQSAAGWWPGLTVECADLTDWQPPSLDGGVDILAAGFSCRDISAAGLRAGLGGASTGPTYRGVLRAIDAWRPRWILLENSPRIRTNGRSAVTGDLVARGYRWRDGVIAASDVGAPHKRDRWYCLAGRSDQGGEREQRGRALHGSAPTANALRDRLQESVQQGWIREADREAIEAAAGYCGAHHWNPPNGSVLRVVDGMANGVRRGDKGAFIAALGDAWTPLQAAAAWKRLGGPVT